MTILADVCIIFAAWSLLAFVVTGPWHWKPFWWAMAITAAALGFHAGLRWAFIIAGRRHGGRLAERVQAKRLMWLSQALTLLTIGVFAALLAGGTGSAVVDVVYAGWLLIFLVLLPAALVPLMLRGLRRRRLSGTP
jgi:hypothetical protein